MLLVICLLTSMSLFYPAAAAKTMTLYQVNSPSNAIAGTETPLPILVTVYYDNAPTGSRLVVGLLDSSSSPERIVPGVVVSSTEPCINQPETSALCTIAVEKALAVVKIGFQIGGIFDGRGQPKVWNLNITSFLISPLDYAIPGSGSSNLLTIDLTQSASNYHTMPTIESDILDKLSHLDYPILVAIALTIVAAAIVAVLLAQRTRRPILARSGSEGPRSDTEKAC